MVVSAIALTVATAIGEALLTAGAEVIASESLTKMRAKLDQWRKQGRYEEIQLALERARQDVLAQCSTDEQRAHVQRVLDTLFQASSGLLLEAFSTVVKQAYSLAHNEQVSTTTLAITYRKISSPSDVVQGLVPDQDTVDVIFQTFFAAFHEQLLRIPDFSYLREYAQLTTARQQVDLQHIMIGYLAAISANTAHPVEETFQLQSKYLAYLVDELKELTLRGFAPQVSGKVLSLPLADIFLPLQATEGRPALASYAEEDLHRQTETALLNEIDQQRYQAEMEKRFAQLRAHLAAQRTLSLRDLVSEPRVVILGDPGMGKSTITRYIAYALAARDTTHLGSVIIERIPILIRIALFAKAFENDSTLHLVDYIEHELLPKAEFGRYIRAEMEAGRCLVILDGLDEVTNPSLRVQVTERIQATVASYGANHFLVTSRIVGYEQSPLTREFKHATMQALTSAEQRRFIQMWYAAIEREVGKLTDTGGADDLIETLDRKPGIARIAANPLLLTIVVLMHWRGVKLPGRRVQVYHVTTDTLIEHWTMLRQVEMDAEAMKAVLAPIAHFILSRSVGGVIAHNNLLPQLNAGIASYYGYDQAESKRQGKLVLKALSEQSGLFLERGYDDNQQPVYGFLHQTFGEYLAALHLANQIFSGTFSLSDYIHRAVWHEPLLLLAGHLSVNSPPLADQLLRDILQYPAAFDEILQRNALLAIECLADDIHVQPVLRQEILDTLARLIHHNTPQVRDAALGYCQRLAQTRHREAAVQSLKRVYVYDEFQNPPAFQRSVGLKVATALVYLGERDLAQPLVWSLSENRNLVTETSNTVRRLRFEFWPEHASEYLYQFLTRAHSPLIVAGPNLERTVIVWLDAGLAYRVLQPTNFLHLLDRLITDVEDSTDRVAIQWIRALVTERASGNPHDPSVHMLYQELLAPHIPEHIRRFAATRLLQGHNRKEGVKILEELTKDTYSQAVAAAQVLIEAGERSEGIWRVVRDTAWMSQHYSAPDAIEVLLKARDLDWGLPAALHLLATCPHSRWQSQRDERWNETVTALLRHGYTDVGLAVARWLTLRPGYRYRIDACELLLEHGRISEAIPLLQFLAYECHDESSQRACQRLLMLGEAERVAPLLACVINTAPPERQYRAALALALVGNGSSTTETPTPRRIDLKVAILDERQIAYANALDNLYAIGRGELDKLSQADVQAQMIHALGVASLQLILRANGRDVGDTIALHLDDRTPALQVRAAYFDLYTGTVAQARQRLEWVLAQPDEGLSIPVHVLAVSALSEAALVDNVDPFITRINHSNATVRWVSIDALSGRNANVAREELLRALNDGSSSIRAVATRVLAQVHDPSVIEGLIATLSDSDEGMQGVAETSLIFQGEMAIQPLMAIVADEDHPQRRAAMRVLHQLHDHVPADYFIRALQDPDRLIRLWSARALGFMRDVPVTEHLLVALQDQDLDVRMNAAEALAERNDPAVLPHILALLHEEDGTSLSMEDASLSRVIGMLGENEQWSDAVIPALITVLNGLHQSRARGAAAALGRLRAAAAVPHLIEKLKSNDASMRGAAASALGQIQDPLAVAPLIEALRDNYSNVVEAAAGALGKVGDISAVKPLMDLLATPNYFGRAATLGALATFDNANIFPTLIEALGDEDEDVRVKAAESLKKYAQTDALRPLLACLADDTARVCTAAIETLASAREQSIGSALYPMLDNVDGNVRSRAAHTLGELGDVQAKIPLMIQLLNEEPPRTAAPIALGELGVVEAGELLETLTIYDDLLAFYEEIIWRVAALLQLRPSGVLAFLKYRRHYARLMPWWEKLYTGQALWLIGEEQAALQALIQALDCERNADTLLAVGHFYIEADDVANAATHILEAVEHEPETPEVLLSQAVILWQQQGVSEAVSCFREAQRIDPDIAKPNILRNRLWRTKAIALVEEIREAAERGEAL